MMAGMPWVKLYVDFLDDHKIGMLDPAVQIFFIKLLLIAGDCDAEGYLANGDTPIEPQHIAWRLRISQADVDSALACLAELDLIGYDDGIILVPAFQKRQGRSQSEKRELWRRRKVRQRGQERDKAECPEGVTRDSPVSPTPREEESREEESREDQESAADAPSATADILPANPSTFPEWQEEIRTSSNRTAVLKRMCIALYPGLDPPAFGRIGTVAGKVGGAGRLAELLWQHCTRPPTGNLMSYIQGVAKNNGKNRLSSGSATPAPLSEQSKAIADALQHGRPGSGGPRSEALPALRGAAHTGDP